MANLKLSKSKIEKNDEFYTRLEDIEKEIVHYKKYFEGKTVFCNCDDPYESNFFKYFALKFNFFKLKRLISTCYNGSSISNDEVALWTTDNETGERKRALKAVIIMDELYDANEDGAVDEDDVKLMLQKPGAITELKGNGSFDSPECIELLKESDIVCTNPPFSKFRDFINVLMKYEKKFIIIGNTNAITYKEVFKHIKDNKIWLGVSSFNTGMYFYVPDNYRLDYKSDRSKEDKKVIRVSSVCWFTNLEHHKRNEPLYLIKQYKGHEQDYPKYDNYDAIEVSKVENIPYDYDGVMGVPITFLDKYCPDQFEIIKFRKGDDDKDLTINGKSPYFRILIRRK